MKTTLKLFSVFALSILLAACTKDEPSDSTNATITIDVDGTVSNGAIFIPQTATTFYLDNVKYEIVESHLEVIGYDKTEISETVKIYGKVNYAGSTYFTRVIQRHAFEYCREIKNLYLPPTLKEIGMYAFCGCTSLATISMPSNEQNLTLGSSVFSSCTSLTSISLPESVKTIPAGCFSGCRSLTSIKLPEKLETIEGRWIGSDWDKGAFGGCISLSSITLPKNITYIGDCAFYRCENLIQITCNSLIPPETGGATFFNMSDNVTLRVPSKSKSLYENADCWSMFKNIEGF